MNGMWQHISDPVFAILIALTTSAILWLFRARVKIVYGSTNWNYHQIPPSEPDLPELHVSSEKFYVQNMGRNRAEKVEIVFSSQPYSYQIFPTRDHARNNLPEGSFNIVIPSLAPGELVILDVLSTGLKCEVLSVNSPDCIPNQVFFRPQRVYSQFVLALVGYLMFAGFVGSIWLVLKFISYLELF